jgi:glycosyltransferase involved in cell wall biosynthesis
MAERLTVLMSTFGTYPYVGGGVSTWCDILCKEAPDVDYEIVAITGHPNVAFRYDVPPNVKRVILVPLWGTEEPAEYILSEVPFSQIYLRKEETTDKIVEEEFLPIFSGFLKGLQGEIETGQLALAIANMNRYFRRYDYNQTWRSRAVWETYKEIMLAPYEEAPDKFLEEQKPSLHDLTVTMQWMYNLFQIINVIPPKTDVGHSTISASSTLVNLMAKVEHGTPLLLTEHGVFVRESYINISANEELSFFRKQFLIMFSNAVSRLSFAFSDQVSPVCDFNRRWEYRYGVPHERMRTIYNGVNPDVFVPRPKPPKTQRLPTVVAAARVFPLKDILTMIRSAAIVRETIPEARFVVYGSLTADPPYVEKCRALIAELELEETFEFGGFHDNPPDIFNEGDISILTSISEGFPYTVLESMSCGRPVVATDVGGVREALEGFGVVAQPKNPQAIAEGVVKLLQDDELRQSLGRKAREEVLAKYRTSATIDAYRKSYEKLASLPHTPMDDEAILNCNLDTTQTAVTPGMTGGNGQRG